MEVSAPVLVQHINSLVWGTEAPREEIFARWCQDEGTCAGGKTPFQEFVDGLKLVSLDSTDELQAIIMSLIPQIMSNYGLLCFLYSILLTHGLEDVKNGMVGEADTLIDPTFGSASQCLLNLLITGRSSPHLFDGERILSGFGKFCGSMLSYFNSKQNFLHAYKQAMQGVTTQPKTGFLTLVEALRYCEVGWYLKNPSTPVWILGSETHFTVLASDNRDLVSVEEPLPAPSDPQSTSQRQPRANLRQAERQFGSLTENEDSGFLSYEQFEVLLGRLSLPVDQQSVEKAKGVIDSEGLGIILREPFLAYYYAEELQRENNPVSNFRLLHYNGLAASNSNGGIRYRYGEANLLDPVDDTNPSGSTPLDRCLKTKWPTIRVTWSNETTPSLN
ncbi:unnamed protein product [Dibothriocephalus latus]|uniref:Ubiquitin carboxyl-terminal hydrolase MINDY n=1 Tax=Dibothriocephalus latus TaxID=60516 RepID=A0A3P6TJU4_DIBLA|nr:unnamed protein product [Dibothriocephalus latus]